jgi:N-acyl-L-homoserine lactone synthetase
MQTTTLSFENLHNYGELFANLFRARKQSFIVEKRWDLPEALDMEYDQYDTPASRWIAIHDDVGQVYAGIRLTPTTARCGIYSYMIRDAQKGLLGSLPQELLYDEAPVHPNTWECTRVFVSHSTPQLIRRRVHGYMVGAMVKSAREQGATKLIAITPSNWPRWYGRCGLTAEAIGPILRIDTDDFQCVQIDLSAKLH